MSGSSPEAGTRPAGRWFFGPLPDLLLGCGLLYVLFFAAQVAAGPELRRWLPIELLPFFGLVLGAPHYGATLLRVYEKREDRQRYRIFAVWVSVALLCLYAASLRLPAVGSWVVTIYLTWSPWHYSGQNYGLTVLFLRRRGVPLERGTQRLLYASFLSSFALLLFTMHAEGPVLQNAPGSYEGTVYAFHSLGLPRGLRDVVAPALFALCAGSLAAGLWRMRSARWRDLGPALCLVALQWLWFTLPAALWIWLPASGIEPLEIGYRGYAFMWIAVGHFAQYLWVTTYYAAGARDRRQSFRYLGRALLVGSVLWTFPTLVLAPGALGVLPWDLGLGLITASIVNLHHFLLDGAIWKLRDGRVARVLLRPADPPRPEPIVPPRSWPRRLLWLGAALVLAASVVRRYEVQAGSRAAQRGDTRRLELSIERRNLLGFASPRTHAHLAREAIRRGDLAAARREVVRGLGIWRTAELLVALGLVHEERGEAAPALDAYDEALDLDPNEVSALVGSARALDELGRLPEAIARLEAALALRPGHALIGAMLESRRARLETTP